MFVRNGEKVFIRVLFTLTLLFFSFQLFNSYQNAMNAGSYSLHNTHGDWEPGTPVVTFYLRDYASMPYLHVLVNGEVAGSFQRRYVTVSVHPGDELSLDGSFYNRPVTIEVLDTSKEVKFPQKGSTAALSGNIISLGKTVLE